MLLAISSSRRGCVRFARFGENFPIWFTIPMNRRSSGTLAGVCIFRMAAVLSGSAVIPFSSTTCPRNFSLFCSNSHFSGFRCHSCRLDAFQNCREPGVVLRLVLPEDQDVVHLAYNTIQTAEDCRHPLLEVLWCTGDAKRELIETIAARRSDEGCQ